MEATILSASPTASAPNEDVATQESAKRSPKIEVPFAERAAYTPNEFASLFGKQTVWGYRQIYAGKVKVITVLGRMMVPASEVKRLQGEAVVYVGPEKKSKRKESQAAEAAA